MRAKTPERAAGAVGMHPNSRTISMLGARISLSEIRFLLGTTVAVLAVTTVPFIYGYLSSPQDKQFMGIMLNVPDTAQYFSWMRGFTSAWIIDNKMTPEPNQPAFFNLLWWTLGRISSYSGWGLAQVFQGFRLVAGALYMLATYHFCALLVERPSTRKVAFLLATLSSGFGWLLVVEKQLTGVLRYPLDVYIPEPNSLLCILAFPHFVISVFLLLSIFSMFLLSVRRERISYAVVAGLFAFVLGLEHAYDLLTVYAVLGVYVALSTFKRRGISWLQAKALGLIVLLSCAPPLYFTWLTEADPLWREVLEQFVNAGVFSPDPFHLTILLGPAFILALATFDGFVPLRDKDEGELFLKAWFATTFFLIYIPVEYQIHLLSGWQIPISILAALGLYKRVAPALAESRWLVRVWGRLRGRVRPSTWSLGRIQSVLAAGLVLAVVPTNLYLWAWRFVDLGRHEHPYYLHQDEIAALQWLDEHAAPEDVVLSSITVGQYIPAYGGCTAFLAHWAQTVDFYSKQERVSEFFDGSIGDDVRLDTVCSFGVDYVFHGPAERSVGGYYPASTPWLEEVFSSPEVRVYRVARQLAHRRKPG